LADTRGKRLRAASLRHSTVRWAVSKADIRREGTTAGLSLIKSSRICHDRPDRGFDVAAGDGEERSTGARSGTRDVFISAALFQSELPRCFQERGSMPAAAARGDSMLRALSSSAA
jgi:hypothetical protein